MVAILRASFLATLLVALSACGGGSGGGGNTIPNDNSACTDSNCGPENEPPDNRPPDNDTPGAEPPPTQPPATQPPATEPPTAPLTCNGIQGAVCPDGYHCVDDSADDCDPATGADCGGICVLGGELPECGGFAGAGCAEGYACVDDPNDDCDAGPAADCPGVCRPEEPRNECSNDMECPQLDALCSYCADGQISCPISRCDAGKCVIAVDACRPAARCGGFAGFGCDAGFDCVDDPSDLCDPRNGDADCFGVCVPQPPPTHCGGIDGMGCPPGSACIDDPDDDCSPDASGADCPATCVPRNGECQTDADCPQLRAPCSECPDGTAACPSSGCVNGVCDVSFPTCKPAVICGDNAEPCKPEHVCVDDPADACDPNNGEVGCSGLCVPREIPRACGGSAGDTCPPGYECFYDTPDGCMPDPSGTECGGICQPSSSAECHSDDECPHILAPCVLCADGSSACPVASCRNGRCEAAFQGCPDPGFCGGIAGFPCPPGLTCVDSPMDDCDPQNGGADCGGICVREEKPIACGGFTGDGCPAGYDCVDEAGDDCDPNNGGADCPGVCRPSEPPACQSDAECAVIGAPCRMCPDGTAACPKSACTNGQCQAIFEGCASEESVTAHAKGGG